MNLSWNGKIDNPDLVDFKPSKKKKGWFHPPLADSEMDFVTKGFVPENTKKSMSWALRVFEEWVAQRNESNANESSQCPVDLLQKADSQELNIWLCRFVTEVRKQTGSPPTLLNRFT